MPEIAAPSQGSALAFDFGEVRIGVAEGSAEVGSAHPIATVTGGGNAEKFAAIDKLVREWQPSYLVVGLPVHTDGTAHEITRLAQKFGRRLHARYRLPVYWADERLSSVYAETLLEEARVFGAKRKSVLDQVAAQAILQSFFNSGAVAYLNGSADSPCLSETDMAE